MKGWKTFVLNTAGPAFFIWLGARGFNVDPETQIILTTAVMGALNLLVRYFTDTPMFQRVPAPVLVAETPAGPVVAVTRASGDVAIVAPETSGGPISLAMVPIATDMLTPAGQETVTLMPHSSG